jgi:hypothetical protein
MPIFTGPESNFTLQRCPPIRHVFFRARPQPYMLGRAKAARGMAPSLWPGDEAPCSSNFWPSNEAMGHARRSSHNALPTPSTPLGDPPPSALTACPAPGTPLPPLDLVAWWIAPPGGPPPRAPMTTHAPGDTTVWWLAPLVVLVLRRPLLLIRQHDALLLLLVLLLIQVEPSWPWWWCLVVHIVQFPCLENHRTKLILSTVSYVLSVVVG